jgi:hypothetical protein
LKHGSSWISVIVLGPSSRPGVRDIKGGALG